MFLAEADIKIKAEPLDVDFSVIKVEELIKPEIEDLLHNCLVLPERSRKNTFNLLIPKEEPQDEVENKLSPLHFRTPSPRTPPRTLSPKPNFQCGTCKRNFNNSQSLDDHKRLRCRNTNVCRFCGQIFRTYLILQDHEQQHKNKKSPSKEPKKTSPLQPKEGSKPPVRQPKIIYICRVCNMSFVAQKTLNKHYKEIHNISKYICNRCGTSFGAAAQFKKHTKGCTEEDSEDALGSLGISSTNVVSVSLVPVRVVTPNVVTESVVAVSDVPIKEEPQDYNSIDDNLTRQLLNGATIVPKVESTETEEMIIDAAGKNVEIQTEDPIDTIPTDCIKEEPVENERESPRNDSSLDYEDLILKELVDRKAKSMARKALSTSIKSSKGLNGDNNGVTSQIESPSLENTDFENIIATNTLAKNRGDQSLAVVKPLNPLATEQQMKAVINENQLGGVAPASKLGTSKTSSKLPTPNASQSNGALVTSPLQTIKIESEPHPVKRKSINESPIDLCSISSSASPSNSQQGSDIETSDSKSYFQNKAEVIESLKEEYQKAKKKKLGEGLPNDAREHSLPCVQPTDKIATPCSVFFPLCGDMESYNEAARILDKAFRYSWICPWCPRRYIQRHAFAKHVSSVHCKNDLDIQDLLFELRPEPAQDVMPESCYCHICRVTLADPDSLQKHRNEFHKKDSTPKVQFKCEKCGKFCSTRSTLADHIEADCGREPQYVCKICDKKFYTKSTLNLHKTMHTGVLPHRCEYCDKCFRTRGQLTVHTRTHTGERPFPCKVCDRRFTHRETLIAHLSRHIDMKRYKCYGCDTFFSCISGLKTHRLTRMSTCGQFRLNARPVGPRVRVIKGNVIFEPQPKINPYFRRYDLNGDENSQNTNENGIFQKQNQENVKDLVKNNEIVSMAQKS